MSESKNILTLQTPQVHNRKITYSFKVCGPLEKFLKTDSYSAEYSFALEELPFEILMVPLIGRIFPAAWLCGAEIITEFGDPDFLSSLEEVRETFENRYPGFLKECLVNCRHSNDNRDANKELSGAVLLYEDRPGYDEVLKETCSYSNVLFAMEEPESKWGGVKAKEKSARLIEAASSVGSSLVTCTLDQTGIFDYDELLKEAGNYEKRDFCRLRDCIAKAAAAAPCTFKSRAAYLMFPCEEDDLADIAESLIKICGTQVIHCEKGISDLKGTEEEKAGAEGRDTGIRIYLTGMPAEDTVAGAMRTEGITSFLKAVSPSIRITELSREEFSDKKDKGMLMIRPCDILAVQGEDQICHDFPDNPFICFRPDTENGRMTIRMSGNENRTYIVQDIMLFNRRTETVAPDSAGILLLFKDDAVPETPEESMLYRAAYGAQVAVSVGSLVPSKPVNRTNRGMIIEYELSKLREREAVLTDDPEAFTVSNAAGVPCVLVHENDSIAEVCERLEKVRKNAGASMHFPKDAGYDETLESAAAMMQEAAAQKRKTEETEPLVTVVVPVYNEEKYLGECLDSLLAQTYKNLEIICVDDGSTDESPRILAEYAGRDARIHIITQKNGGLSRSRNNGTDHASGKYISYLDSDDSITPHHIEKLVRRMEEDELDVCLINMHPYITEEEDDSSFESTLEKFRKSYKRCHSYPDVYTGAELMGLMTGNNEYIVNTAACFSRLSCIKKLEKPFYEGILHEDNLFMFRLLLGAGRAAYEPEVYHQRRLSGGSIMTSNVTFRNVEGYFRCFMEMYRITCESGFSDEVRHIALIHTEKTLNSVKYTYANLSKWSERNGYKSMDPEDQLIFRSLIVNNRAVRVTRLENERVALLNRILKKDNEVRAFMAENDKLSALNKELSKAKEESDKARAGTSRTKNRLEKELNSLKAETAAREEEYRKERSELVKDRDAFKKQTEELMQKISTLEKQNAELEENLRTVHSSIAYKGLHKIRLM